MTLVHKRYGYFAMAPFVNFSRPRYFFCFLSNFQSCLAWLNKYGSEVASTGLHLKSLLSTFELAALSDNFWEIIYFFQQCPIRSQLSDEIIDSIPNACNIKQFLTWTFISCQCLRVTTCTNREDKGGSSNSQRSIGV